MKRLSFLLCLSFCHSVFGKCEFTSSSVEKVTLVELYTSQGCASCPPTDEWLNKLIDSTNLFKTFVPIAFHVDYWNHLGHRDPFSNPLFSDRQRAYSAFWGTPNIYTPQIILGGQEWKGGAFPDLKATKNLGGKLDYCFDQKRNSVKIQFESPYPERKILLGHVAYLGSGLTTKVTSGENVGKKLESNFVALSWKSFPLKERKNIYRGHYRFKKLPPSTKAHLAVWITESTSLLPLQAAGLAL